MPQRKKQSRPKPRSRQTRAPAKPRNQPQMRQPPRLTRQVAAASVKAVCAITDPFCPAAEGSKYYDDSSAKTLSYTFRGRTGLSSDSIGTLRYLFYPQYGFNPVTDSATNTGSIATSWNNFSADSSIDGVESFRIVSCGFRLRSIIAPLNASGELNVRSWSNYPAALGTVSLLSYNATDRFDRATRLVDDVCTVLSHTNAPPQLFYPTGDSTSAVTSTTSNGFNPVTIYSSSLPASTGCYILEWVVHYELKFLDNSSMNLLATPAKPMNTQVVDAAKRVSSQLPTFFEKGVKAVSDMLVRRASAALGSFLGGPAGGMAASLIGDII